MSAELEAHIAAWQRQLGLRVQERLTEFVPIPSGAMKGAADDIIGATLAFQSWASEEACLEPGEYPPQAWLAAMLTRYVCDVRNGGHDQWAFNLRLNESAMQATGLGLKLLGLETHCEIWRRYLAYVSSERVRSAILDRRGFGPRDRQSSEIDHAFSGLETGSISKALAAWLIAEGCLMEMTEEEAATERHAAISRNALRASRIEQRLREKEEADPLAKLARELCKRAKVAPHDVLLARERPGVARDNNGKAVLICGIETDAGQLLIRIWPPAILGESRAEIGRLIYEKGMPFERLAETRTSREHYKHLLEYFAIPAKGR